MELFEGSEKVTISTIAEILHRYYVVDYQAKYREGPLKSPIQLHLVKKIRIRGTFLCVRYPRDTSSLYYSSYYIG